MLSLDLSASCSERQDWVGRVGHFTGSGSHAMHFPWNAILDTDSLAGKESTRVLIFLAFRIEMFLFTLVRDLEFTVDRSVIIEKTFK